MNPLRLTLVLIFLSPVVASEIRSEIISIDGTVKSIDAKKRTITVETGRKELTLDVGSKAKITIDGSAAALEDLETAGKITLSFHDQLEVVLSIEVSSKNHNWVNLFNGNDLKGWKFRSPEIQVESNTDDNKKPDGLWFVDAERKVLVSQGKETCWLETDKTFKNFRLRCEWRFLSGRKVTDSGGGIVVRANGKNLNGRNPRGIEIDLLPSEMPGLGSFMLYGTPLESKEGKAIGEQNVRLKRIREPKVNPDGQWNKCEVRCEDDRVEVTINGTVVNEAWGAREEFGTICLRNQSSELEYRNVQLLLLDLKVVKDGEAK